MKNSPAKTRTAALLRQWSKAGQRETLTAGALGVAQYALFVGFAWCAAGALQALIDGDPPWRWLMTALVFALARAAAQAGETRLGFEAGAKVRAHVRRAAAEALSERGPAFTESQASGELSSALVDAVEKLDGYYARYRPLQPVLIGAPLVILIAAFSASWVVGAVFLVTAPLLPLFMALVGAGAAAASKDQMDVLRRLAGRFNDRLQALETLNAFDAASREGEGLAAAAEDFRQRTMKVLRLAFLSSAVLEFFAALAIAATAVYVGFSLLGELPFDSGETLSLHTGAFVLILAPEFYLPLRRLSAAYHDRADAEAAAEALAPFFDDGDAVPTAGDTAPLQTAPRIRFDQAGSIYADGRRGLEALSFEAPAGAITVLWGPSGVGKSTALKLLMGYAPLSQGRVRVDGKVLSAPLAGRAAWMGQRPRMLHGTLRENIALFDPQMNDEAIHAAAEAAGVNAFADALPDGLGARLGERGHGVSGGQAQRVALARALARDMKLILMDEPTAHLDGQTAARFIEALQHAAQGRTVLIATHDPALRAIADRVVELAPQEASA
ncbi:MAG: thiol reductant ABC exporter subunit CydD [Pseudomonadota bacterium]